MPNKEALQPQLERLFSGFQDLIAIGEKTFPDEVDPRYPERSLNSLSRSFWFFYRKNAILPLKQHSQFDIDQPITFVPVEENMFEKVGVTKPESFTIKLNDFLDNLLKLRRMFFVSYYLTLFHPIYREEKELGLEASYENGISRDLLHLKPADSLGGYREFYSRPIQGNHAKYVAQTLKDNFLTVQPTHVGISLYSIPKDKRAAEETVEIDNKPLIKREVS